jgi:hypothetical protein
MVWLERLGKLKKIDLIGNQTRDLQINLTLGMKSSVMFMTIALTDLKGKPTVEVTSAECFAAM